MSLSADTREGVRGYRIRARGSPRTCEKVSALLDELAALAECSAEEFKATYVQHYLANNCFDYRPGTHCWFCEHFLPPTQGPSSLGKSSATLPTSRRQIEGKPQNAQAGSRDFQSSVLEEKNVKLRTQIATERERAKQPDYLAGFITSSGVVITPEGKTNISQQAAHQQERLLQDLVLKEPWTPLRCRFSPVPSPASSPGQAYLERPPSVSSFPSPAKSLACCSAAASPAPGDAHQLQQPTHTTLHDVAKRLVTRVDGNDAAPSRSSRRSLADSLADTCKLGRSPLQPAATASTQAATPREEALTASPVPDDAFSAFAAELQRHLEHVDPHAPSEAVPAADGKEALELAANQLSEQGCLQRQTDVAASAHAAAATDKQSELARCEGQLGSLEISSNPLYMQAVSRQTSLPERVPSPSPIRISDAGVDGQIPDGKPISPRGSAGSAESVAARSSSQSPVAKQKSAELDAFIAGEQHATPESTFPAEGPPEVEANGGIYREDTIEGQVLPFGANPSDATPIATMAQSAPAGDTQAQAASEFSPLGNAVAALLNYSSRAEHQARSALSRAAAAVAPLQTLLTEQAFDSTSDRQPLSSRDALTHRTVVSTSDGLLTDRTAVTVHRRTRSRSEEMAALTHRSSTTPEDKSTDVPVGKQAPAAEEEVPRHLATISENAGPLRGAASVRVAAAEHFAAANPGPRSSSPPKPQSPRTAELQPEPPTEVQKSKQIGDSGKPQGRQASTPQASSESTKRPERSQEESQHEQYEAAKLPQGNAQSERNAVLEQPVSGAAELVQSSVLMEHLGRLQETQAAGTKEVGASFCRSQPLSRAQSQASFSEERHLASSVPSSPSRLFGSLPDPLQTLKSGQADLLSALDERPRFLRPRVEGSQTFVPEILPPQGPLEAAATTSPPAATARQPERQPGWGESRYVLPGSLPPTALETRTGPGRNFFQAPQPHHHPVPHYSRPGRDLVPENSLAFTYPAHTDAVIWAVPDIEQQRQLFERRDHEEGAMPEGGFGGLQRFGAAQHPLYERKRMASQTVTDAYLPSLQLKPATQSEPGRVASRPYHEQYEAWARASHPAYTEHAAQKYPSQAHVETDSWKGYVAPQPGFTRSLPPTMRTYEGSTPHEGLGWPRQQAVHSLTPPQQSWQASGQFRRRFGMAPLTLGGAPLGAH